MSVHFPKAHGLFFMMEIYFLITSRNLAMEYHFIQREGSNTVDRLMLEETGIDLTLQPQMGHLALKQNLSIYFTN